MLASIRQVLRLAAWAATAGLLVACPWGGGRRDPRQCEPSGNYFWNEAGTSVSRKYPETCPYSVVTPGATLHFEVDVIASASKLPFPIGSAAFGRVYDADRVLRLDDANVFIPYPLDQSKSYARLRGPYAAGFGQVPRDSAEFRFQTKAGFAVGWLDIPGTVTAAPPRVQGPTHPAIGVGGQWMADTPADPVSYTFQWRLDGQNIPGETREALWYTFQDHTSHTLSVVATRTDGTWDEAYLTVHPQDPLPPQPCVPSPPEVYCPESAPVPSPASAGAIAR